MNNEITDIGLAETIAKGRAQKDQEDKVIYPVGEGASKTYRIASAKSGVCNTIKTVRYTKPDKHRVVLRDDGDEITGVNPKPIKKKQKKQGIIKGTE